MATGWRWTTEENQLSKLRQFKLRARMTLRFIFRGSIANTRVTMSCARRKTDSPGNYLSLSQLFSFLIAFYDYAQESFSFDLVGFSSLRWEGFSRIFKNLYERLTITVVLCIYIPNLRMMEQSSVAFIFICHFIITPGMKYSCMFLLGTFFNFNIF